MPTGEQRDGGRLSGDGSPTGLQEQERVQLGEQAAQVLKSDVYNLAFERMRQKLITTWIGTEDKNNREREAIWNKLHGLMDVNDEMIAMVVEAQDIIQRHAEEQSPARREADYLDQQGFGLNLN